MIIPLINPASISCNIRCRYCFHRNKSLHIDSSKNEFMKISMFEYIINNLCESYPGEEKIEIIWHGGEPLLAGKKFFAKIVEIQEKLFKEKRKVIVNNLQTNTTLINEEWIPILKHPSFCIGVSLDGPKEIHDQLRLEKNNKGTFTKVMHSVSLLIKNKIPVSAVSVINNNHLGKVKKYFDFFAKSGIKSIKVSPCIEFDSSNEFEVFSLRPGDFSKFCQELFDLWISSGNTNINFGYIEDIVRAIAKGESGVCLLSNGCKDFIVIDPDGSFHPCDDLFGRENILGNIKNHNFSDLQTENKNSYGEFYSKINQSREDCLNCEWFFMCQKGCPYLWDNNNQYLLCEDNKRLFSHITNFIASL